MSKLIQSAYNCIESGKYKKAITILDSPELDRFPIAKVHFCLTYCNDIIVVEGILCYGHWQSEQKLEKQCLNKLYEIGDTNESLEVETNR